MMLFRLVTSDTSELVVAGHGNFTRCRVSSADSSTDIQRSKVLTTQPPDYALNNNLTPFINCQNLYNLLYREEEREMMPLLKYLGVGSTPWSPVARGRKCVVFLRSDLLVLNHSRFGAASLQSL